MINLARPVFIALLPYTVFLWVSIWFNGRAFCVRTSIFISEQKWCFMWYNVCTCKGGDFIQFNVGIDSICVWFRLCTKHLWICQLSITDATCRVELLGVCTDATTLCACYNGNSVSACFAPFELVDRKHPCGGCTGRSVNVRCVKEGATILIACSVVCWRITSVRYACMGFYFKARSSDQLFLT